MKEHGINWYYKEHSDIHGNKVYTVMREIDNDVRRNTHYTIYQKSEQEDEYYIKIKNGICPECGSPNLVHEGGCVECPVCGWSACM